MRARGLRILVGAWAVAVASAAVVLPAEPPAGPPAVAGFEFLIASLSAADGDVAGALTALDRAVASAPEDPYVRIERAELLMRVGRVTEAARDARFALERRADEPEMLRLAGRVELALGERDPEARQRAEADFDRLLELAPADLEAMVTLAQLRLARGDAVRAAALLEEASRLRPDQPMIQSLLLQALERAGDPAAKEAIQREWLARDPSNLAMRIDLADALSRRGLHGEAVGLLAAAPGDQGSTPEVRRRRASELYLAGELEPARELVAGLLAESPDLGSVRYLSALVALAEGYPERAVLELAALVARAPQNRQLGSLRAEALARMGRIDESVAERDRLATILADRPDESAEEALSAVVTLLGAKRFDEAAARARHLHATTASPLAAPARRLQAEALAGAGRLDEAIELLGGLESADLNDLGTQADLWFEVRRVDRAEEVGRRLLELGASGELEWAAVLQRRERFAESLPILERARNREPESVEVAFWHAMALERSGRLEPAVASFRALIEAWPDFVPALNYLGYMLVDRGTDLDGGTELARRALRLDPDNGAYADSVGWGLFRLGRLGEARTMLERARRLLPDDPTILEHLGDLLRAQGETAGAREAYLRAQQLGAEDPEALAGKLADLAEGGV